MAATKIRKAQIENLQIADADVAAGAAIASSKLADGANFTKKDGSVVFTGDQSMGNNKITNLGAPVSANDAARLADVQAAAAGLSAKDAVRVATTANITLSGTQTIDGISVVAGDRVLVKNQSTASQNGIYVCAVGAWSRATDADSTGELKAGSFVFVTEGTTNGDSGWMVSTDGTITIGTTSIAWVQFSALGQVVAGAGLTKNGNTLDIGTASAARIVVNADNIDLATTGVSAGTFQGITVDTYGRVTGATDQGFVRGTNFVNREAVSGTKNGVNTAFTLANTPVSGSEMLFLNGQLLTQGVGQGYTISGANITMLDPIPTAADVLLCTYFK